MSKKIYWIVFYSFIWLSFFKFQTVYHHPTQIMVLVYAAVIGFVGWVLSPYKMFFPLEQRGLCQNRALRIISTYMVYFMLSVSCFQIKDMLPRSIKENLFSVIFSLLGGIVFGLFFDKRSKNGLVA